MCKCRQWMKYWWIINLFYYYQFHLKWNNFSTYNSTCGPLIYHRHPWAHLCDAVPKMDAHTFSFVHVRCDLFKVSLRSLDVIVSWDPSIIWCLLTQKKCVAQQTNHRQRSTKMTWFNGKILRKQWKDTIGIQWEQLTSMLLYCPNCSAATEEKAKLFLVFLAER